VGPVGKNPIFQTAGILFQHTLGRLQLDQLQILLGAWQGLTRGPLTEVDLIGSMNTVLQGLRFHAVLRDGDLFFTELALHL
jgi:hypothetical protein